MQTSAPALHHQKPQLRSPFPLQILSYIDIGQREGARLLCGGKQKGSKGYFVSQPRCTRCALPSAAAAAPAWSEAALQRQHGGTATARRPPPRSAHPRARCPASLPCPQVEPTVFADVTDDMTIAQE